MFSSSSIKSSTSSTTLPCSYISSTMDKSSTFLKKFVKPTFKVNTVTPTTPISSKHIPITIPTKLTPSQKEAALPFLTQEPPKSKSSKLKTLSRFFKKLAKVTPAKDCIKSSSENKKTQYKLTFIPVINKKKEIVSSSKAEATEIVWYDSEISSTTKVFNSNTSSTIIVNESATEYAQRIWDEDNTVYNNLDKVVEWIGNGKPTSNSILESYMAHFDFKDLKLEQAFRNLCSKLYLKGETQQIDRILLQFSTRYFECNPHCIFGTTDIVHAIVYSLLLLNTDLHVAQGDYKKMSQSAFVKNTMDAISIGSPAAISRSINSVQSFDWIPLQRTPSTTSDDSTRSSNYARSLDSALPRNLSFGSKSWQVEIKNVLKQMYSNIRHSQITNPSSPPTSIHDNRVLSASFRCSVATIIKKKVVCDDGDATTLAPSVQSTSSAMHYVASHLLEDTELPISYASNAPYYKEGMVVIKHLLEAKNQKAKHRNWKECFMVIERSQLRMYKLDTTTDSTSIGGGNWMYNAQLIGSIDLKHTLAKALASGYSRQRQHAFSLQQSNGAIFVFQTGSADQVQEWVSTCNYWAARESKEPLVGGISSMEYGWGNCLEGEQSVMIHEWQAPASPTISSMLKESAQIEVLYKHVQELSTQLDIHRDIKPKMQCHFGTSKFGSRAMANWENKSHYILHEIIKYQNYCNSIEKSLSLQASIIMA